MHPKAEKIIKAFSDYAQEQRKLSRQTEQLIRHMQSCNRKLWVMLLKNKAKRIQADGFTQPNPIIK